MLRSNDVKSLREALSKYRDDEIVIVLHQELGALTITDVWADGSSVVLDAE